MKKHKIENTPLKLRCILNHNPQVRNYINPQTLRKRAPQKCFFNDPNIALEGQHGRLSITIIQPMMMMMMTLRQALLLLAPAAASATAFVSAAAAQALLF